MSEVRAPGVYERPVLLRMFIDMGIYNEMADVLTAVCGRPVDTIGELSLDELRKVTRALRYRLLAP